MNEKRSTSRSNSHAAQRILAGIVALPLTAFALLVIRTQFRTGFDPIGVIIASGAGMVAILCWWFALRGHIADDRVRMRFSVTGGLILGGIGFAAGFFGPIILMPDANQGPLIGILITGPLGLVLGAVLGWLYGRFRTRGPRPG